MQLYLVHRHSLGNCNRIKPIYQITIMKVNKFIIAALAGASIIACSPKSGVEGGTAAKDLMPTKAQLDSVSYLVGINFGSFLKGYNMDDLNYATIEKGMKDFLKAEGDMYSEDFGKQFKIDPNTMSEVINAYLQKKSQYALLVNKQKGEEFLAKNKAKANVQVTASGLQYEIIEVGNDKHPGPVDTVLVRYKGTLLDGTVFDEVKPDADPIELKMNSVIAGWTEGLQLIGEGGKMKLYIPADLAYGERRTGNIEPNSTLIFDIELSEVRPVVEAE